jgi:hypothetical protein
MRDVVNRAPLSSAFKECWGARTLPRPLFVAEEEMSRAADDVLSFFDLLASLLGRAYDGDVERYCRDLHIDPARATIVQRFANGAPVRYGRADLYHDGEGFRLLEFNVSSDLGGADRSQLLSALMMVPEFAEFAEEHGVRHVETGACIARALRAASPANGAHEPVVALLCAPGGIARYRHLLAAFVEMMREQHIDIRLGEADEVTERGDRLLLGASPLDIVFRFFTVDDVCTDPDGARWVERLIRAHETGTVVLWTPMDSSLYSNKGALALLHSRRVALKEEEHALVSRLLPWTSQLSVGHGWVHGQEVDLVDYCREHRETLILKPLREAGGAGIVAGWEHDASTWERMLDSGVREGYLVQRRVEPRREVVVDVDSGEDSEWIAAWGLFVTPQGYAGTDVRALPSGAGAIVNYGMNSKTCTTGVFTHARDSAGGLCG